MERSSAGAEYDAWLASPCMPSSVLKNLLDVYGWDPAKCYAAFQHKDAAIMDLISPRFFRLLENNSSESRLAYWRELIRRYSISTIHMTDPSYPENMMYIDNPPAILFCRGNTDCLKERKLAMVGSRAASYSGQKAAHRIARDLSREKITVVSGLACGIDASAHQGCIEGRSPTIAVTANGLDRVYPADNEKLQNEILDHNGLLLTEYAPGEKPAGWHFPIRNRIIAGLSQALILIEARIKSGSMTTVQHALNQGKDVFVYPGDPVSDHYEGNHQLLREGGIYFTSADDILEDLHWLDKNHTVGHNIDCSAALTSPEESAVFQALQPGSLTFEQLLVNTGIETSHLMSTITILQIRGLIEALPGKQYQLRRKSTSEE